MFFQLSLTCLCIFSFLPRYLTKPRAERTHVSVDGKTLDKGLMDLTKVTTANRDAVFKEVFVNGKPRSDLPLQVLFVTPEEREAASI